MTSRALPSFVEWVGTRDPVRTGDPLWAVQAYRLASYAVHCHTFDRQANGSLAKAAAVDQLTRR